MAISKKLTEAGRLVVKFVLVTGIVAGGVALAGRNNTGLDNYIADLTRKACVKDSADSGLPTKVVGTECYYQVGSNWIDIIDLAANASAAGNMKPAFKSQLDERAKAAIEARRPKNDFMPMVA